MARETKAQQAERLEAIDKLREIFPPHSTARTILRHVSRSGMRRSISVIGQDCADVTFWVARAMGERIDQKNGGIIVDGCGMDMGFSLISNLGYALYPSGYPCTGSRDTCRSSDHHQGRTYRGERVPYSAEEIHPSGCYAINHRWL